MRKNKQPKGVIMEKEYYLEPIVITDQFKIQIDSDNHDNLLIYQKNEVVEIFSLKRRVYTLFKLIQSYVESNSTIHYNKNNDLYAQAILIKDDLYMQVTDQHQVTVVEFYKKKGNEKKTLYITKMTCMAKTLFNQLLVAIEVDRDPDYQAKFPRLFKDMLDVLGLIHI
jgi:hypothetical protein